MFSPDRASLLLTLLKNHLSETIMQSSEWDDLANLHDFGDIAGDHPRLYRSLYFNDDDYSQSIREVLLQAEARKPGTIEAVADYVGFSEYLQQHDESNYRKLYGLAGASLHRVSTVSLSTAIDVNREVDRIQRSLHSDPELALGSAKEMIEAVLKKILMDYGETPSGEDVRSLMKKVQQKLDLDPAEVAPTLPGAKSVKQILSGLSRIVQGLTELRNLYGTGHGKAAPSNLQDHQVQLAITAAGAAAAFLLEVHGRQQRLLTSAAEKVNHDIT